MLAYERRDVEEMVALISQGAVKTGQLISDTIRLDEIFEKGYDRMMAPTKDVFRILVSPSS